MKRMTYIVLWALFFQSAYSQTLTRKGGLGVSLYTQVNDSLQTSLHYKTGAVLQQIFPNTTAQKAGLLANDIITRINQSDILNAADLIAYAKTLRQGQSITIHLLRNEKDVTIDAIVVPKPMEQSTTINIIYGSFAYKGGQVRTIYKIPKGKEPKAYIYFLQGLPCYSLDNMQPLDKTKQAIDKLVSLGYGVYIMEKGDMGDNENCPPCATMGFTEELSMYDAGYLNFKKMPGVDTTRIFLFGHSMGGTTAPLLAAKYQPRGVIVYGTGFKPWSEYLFDAYLIQLSLRGMDIGDLRESIEIYKPYINQFFYTDIPVDSIAKNPKGFVALSQILGYNATNQTGASGRHISTFRELNQYNVAKAFSVYDNYTLAIYGECDLNANSPADNLALIDHVNAQHPGHGTFWLAPRSSHTFEEIGTMQEFIELWDNQLLYQQYAATRFNSKIFDYVDHWIDSTQFKKTEKIVASFYRNATDQLPPTGAKKASMDCKASDLDGDGDADIILANEFEANTILINDGTGQFTDQSAARLPQVVHDSEDVLAEDMNGDGYPDLIFCSEDDKIHEYYLNDGKGYFKPAPYTFQNSMANAVISGDINKDGKPDIIFGNNGQNQVYINNGAGLFLLEVNRLPQLSKITQDLALVDIDNDKDLDLVEANEDGNQLYLNNGKGFFTNITTTHFISNDSIESRKIAVGDVDGDGDMDLFFANVNFTATKNNQNHLYLNNGKGKFTDVSDKRLPLDDDHSIDAIFEDIDTDGDKDIIIANVFGGKLKVYINNGTGYFSIGSDKLLGGKIVMDALGVIATDLNGDHINDLFFCNRYTPQNDGTNLLLIRK